MSLKLVFFSILVLLSETFSLSANARGILSEFSKLTHAESADGSEQIFISGRGATKIVRYLAFSDPIQSPTGRMSIAGNIQVRIFGPGKEVWTATTAGIRELREPGKRRSVKVVYSVNIVMMLDPLAKAIINRMIAKGVKPTEDAQGKVYKIDTGVLTLDEEGFLDQGILACHPGLAKCRFEVYKYFPLSSKI